MQNMQFRMTWASNIAFMQKYVQFIYVLYNVYILYPADQPLSQDPRRKFGFYYNQAWNL